MGSGATLNESLPIFGATRQTSKGTRIMTSFKVKKGKGVLCKDNKTPYAACSLHVVQGGWNSPSNYTMANLLLALTNPEVDEIRLITEDNTEYTVTKV